MESKIRVTVCTGTACYVLGGSELLLLDEMIPDDWRDRIELCASECLESCHTPNAGRPPFVRIDNELIESANPVKVLALLRERLN